MSFLDWVNHKETIQSLMDELIPYQVCGVYADLNGASIYYPLNYNEAQLEEYVRLSAAPNYSTLLHEIYADLPEELILFQDRGSIGESGSFDMELEESSLQYVRSITMRTWREREDIPGKYALLGDSEVDTYVTELERKLARPGVSCQLSGEAYALDGHFLLPGVSGMRLTQFYTSPVQVNGEDTSYIFVVAQSLFRHIHKIIYTMIGSLVDENGLPSRVIGHLKRGDRISIYSATDETGENLVLQDEFVVKEDDIWPELDPLPEGQNRCQYIVTDIIGRTVSSDYGIFEIGEEDGERTVQLKEIVKTLSEE